MSRVFNGSAGSDEFITLAAGALLDGGPITVLTYWRPSVGEANQFAGLVAGRASGSNQWTVLCDSGQYFHENDFTGTSGVAADAWQIVGYSKAAGTASPRWHLWDGSWNHVDSPSSVGDGSAVDSVLIGAYGVGSGRLDGLWVCAAVWNSVLSDGAIEAACSPTALQAWFDASPDALWAGNQASTSDPVEDLTGSGADQTASLNPGVGGADPPVWSYTISSGTDLVVASAVHAQAADTPTLTQTYTVVAAGATHGQTAGQPDLTQTHAVAAVDATQAQVAGEPGLTQAHEITAAGTLHAQTADEPALTQTHQLAALDATHTQTAGQASLTVASTLAPDDAAHGQAASSPTATQQHVLTVAAAVHAQTVEAAALAQLHQLVASGALHGQTAGAATVIEPTDVTAALTAATAVRSTTASVATRSTTASVSTRSTTAEVSVR